MSYGLLKLKFFLGVCVFLGGTYGSLLSVNLPIEAVLESVQCPAFILVHF